MFTARFSPRVYETDAFGHINNTVVPCWFEAAREPIFRIFTPEMDLKALNIIIARIEVDYVAQIHYGHEVTVHTGIARIGNSSFVVWHEAFQRGQLVAKGSVVHVYFDFSQQKSGPLPEPLKAALKEHLRAE
ncbi:acyl-CoA thioester hydrolase [Fluviicoccus keumensis]|uniref:Acyl-CoA thioester hydrolase n=1 Tax=Fluviicoccus keumensis TaxID=1435465 RepID=A0A4Q7ZBT1_9GAMM|nr:thioesterase family protein [Fluviicoccus keumensis]RZU47405.1 acyl-CoA thioester hydrolase [Fluviicoccus keumensis]